MASTISPAERVTDAGQSREARIDALLADTSHHIEFNGHLSNHSKHAVVALAGLGASANRIEEYYCQYAKETTYGCGLEPKRPSRYTVTDENCLSLLGRRTSFSSWCDYFSALTEREGLPAVLEKWMPILLPGWVGAFTHATIHLGWGLDYGHPRMITEGIAYMAFSWVSCHPERQTASCYTGDATALDSLIAISTALEQHNTEYQAWVQRVQNGEIAPEKAACHSELKRSGLQYLIAMSVAEGHPLMDAIPVWLHHEKMDTLWLQLYYAATIIYLARPGDFVNLHLITSLYAMERIANQLPEQQHRDVVRLYWQGMMGILFSSGDFPDAQTMARLDARLKNQFDDMQKPEVQQHWQTTITAAIDEAEEHNPKLVYVMRKIGERTHGLSIYREAARAFTTTPELPDSFSQQADDGI